MLYTLLQSVLPLVSLYLLKLLVDNITGLVSTGGEGLPIMSSITGNQQLITALIAFCAVFLVGRVVVALSGYNSDVMQQKLIDYISDVIHRQSSRLDLAYYDNPDYHDTFHRAQQEASVRPLQVINNLMGASGSVVSIIGVLVILAGGSWIVPALMVVAVLPSFMVRLAKSRRIYRFRRDATPMARRSNYYSALLTSWQSAKEVRSFGIAPILVERFASVRAKLVRELMRISRWIAASDVLCGVIETAALLVVIILLCSEAAGGAITIGSFVMMFEAFRRGQGYMSTLIAALGGLYDNKLFLQNLFEFLELEPRIVSPDKARPFPEKVERVDFENITFAYPPSRKGGKSHAVLKGYSLTARSGEVTHIKGENGFGKSTLLKLLLRLYDPDDGRVTINGIDLREFDLKDLRRNVSALFQDFVRFYMTVADNVRMGDAETVAAGVGDGARIGEALRLSAADAVVSRLPDGIETPLGRIFDDGEELSMGEWQRIALARAVYSKAPVMVLDEPMAWMDAPTREVFKSRLDELKEGRVVILISHL